MSEQQASVLASGLKRDEIDAMLRAAEPHRMEALSASINLVLCAFLLLAARSFDGSFLWIFVAAAAAIAVWRLSQRLWRDIAMAVLAPSIGERWGQTGFASGWGTVELGKWLVDVFSPEGARFTAWQSHGRYRDIDYRMSESTIWRPRRKNAPKKIDHVMQMKVAIPHSVSGRIELTPRSDFFARIDEIIQKMSGAADRRLEIDPAFDAVFDTTASQPASASAVLTPDFRRAMLALAARHPHLYLKAHSSMAGSASTCPSHISSLPRQA